MKPSLLSAPQVKQWIPRRPLDAHKGKNGHLLVVAGSRGMSGAAFLSGLGALRAGAGLVTVATVESERAVMTSALPEVLTLGLPETAEGAIAESAIDSLIQYLRSHSVNALAVGPGLSVNPQTAKVICDILDEFDLPLVLDADGLNTISPEATKGYSSLVITPHPAELARFVGVDREKIKHDRVQAAQTTARDHELVCVLKGHHTVISDGQSIRLNPTGNPALAAGGMGDVLTGVIGAFLAQGLGRFEAACAGAYLHGLAGDIARISDRGLLAREVAHAIPAALKKIGVR
jgi:ADP-dependent NAD(P)H-hydrate dehydratase / NAD(P)H-hydrate epimerase